MSESSNYGESPSSSSHSKYASASYPPPYSSPSPSKVDTQVFENNLNGVKQKLKKIENYVIQKLNTEEIIYFQKLYRTMIVENEAEVIAFPRSSFFIAKFEELDITSLDLSLKSKILGALYEKQQDEKNENSKLKYW